MNVALDVLPYLSLCAGVALLSWQISTEDTERIDLDDAAAPSKVPPWTP